MTNILDRKKDIYSLRSNKIIAAIQNFRQQGNVETAQINIYNDGCWKIDMDMFSNGNIRFWVSAEDKRNGSYKSSICSVYEIDNTVRLACSFTIKPRVQEKLIKTYRDLKDKNII